MNHGLQIINYVELIYMIFSIVNIIGLFKKLRIVKRETIFLMPGFLTNTKLCQTATMNINAL